MLKKKQWQLSVASGSTASTSSRSLARSLRAPPKEFFESQPCPKPVSMEDVTLPDDDTEVRPLVLSEGKDIPSIAFSKPRQRSEVSHQIEFDLYKRELAAVKAEIASFRIEMNKKLDDEKLVDKLGEVRKGNIMTQFSCKWFAWLVVFHLVFYYFYYVLRGDVGNTEDDDFDPIKYRILQVSVYSAIYLFICLFDILWTSMFSSRVTCERDTERTHVIVAAHRAHDSLAVMLPSVLKTFEPETIHVADNGFCDDATRKLCTRLGVNYHYNDVGNKCNALVVVARKIRQFYGDSVENVLLLDDDTLLEDDFFIRHDLLGDPRVAGYCVGIGVDRSPPLNIWEIAIDFEYRAISYSFGAQATTGTIPFCHGICAVYKIDLLIEQFEKNWSLPGGLPFGEDGYAGLDFRLSGYKLKQDNANLVLTYCPRQFFPPLCSNGRVQGYGASSLWKQRACRWFLSWPRQLPREIWLFFTYKTGSWYGNIAYRIYFFWWLFLNLVSVGWFPYMFYVYFHHESWVLVFILKGVLTATGVVVAILRIIFFPPKLRKGIHPLAPICAPILGMANAVLRFFGFVQCIYWFIPFIQVDKIKVVGGEGENIEEGNDSDNLFDEMNDISEHMSLTDHISFTEELEANDDNDDGTETSVFSCHIIVDDEDPPLPGFTRIEL